ncbi:MAG: hypothetical protein BroJett033_1910 [Chloroflexota bacterium]|nr:MAG: hypothetical protein BroJett033_1910 [Chloroflexota bacterium]
MQQLTALVVDDEVAMRTLYEMVLGTVGFTVQCAADGEQALALLQWLQPDVIFLDMLLPKHDGREVLSYCESVPRLRCTPVVIVSAHGHFRHLLALKPADRFLVKPVRPGQMREAALAAISHRA